MKRAIWLLYVHVLDAIIWRLDAIAALANQDKEEPS